MSVEWKIGAVLVRMLSDVMLRTHTLWGRQRAFGGAAISTVYVGLRILSCCFYSNRNIVCKVKKAKKCLGTIPIQQQGLCWSLK